ncbi:MAG: flagellar filament capping protein FliD [Lachnospiraceae bacterium]|nr:flagellar filament capping protein FliD [Lachnospiraceae bacterium]
MGIRVSGMASGMDTDSIVEGLTSAYQVKIDNVNKKKKSVELKKDAWSAINTSLLSFYKGSLTKVKTKGSYKSKQATVSGSTSTLASVTASSKAASGSYSMTINKMASAAYISGAKVTSSSFTGTYNAGNARKFSEMAESSEVSDLTGKTLTFEGSQIQNKVNSDGNKLFSLSDTEGNPVEIKLYDTSGNYVESVTEATEAQIKDFYKYMKAEDESFDSSKFTKSAVMEDKEYSLTYTFDDTSSVADINSSLTEAGIKGIKAVMKEGVLSFENTAGYDKDEDGKVINPKSSYIVSGEALTTLGFASNSIDLTPTASEPDEEGNRTYTTSVTSGSKFTYEVQNETLKNTSKLANFLGSDMFDKTDEETGKKYFEVSLQVGTNEAKTVKIYEDATAKSFAEAISNASGGKINASYDQTNGRFFITSKGTGANNGFSLTGVDKGDDALKKLGLVADDSLYQDSDVKMSTQKASDAEITINGAVITSSTNAVKVDGLGLTINVEKADPSETLTVNVSNDTEGVRSMVKDFLKEYNNLITDFATKYYAEKNDYQPLTEEEEAAMTETQITKWNEKVQSALLRRDDRLNSLMSNMRTSLTQSFSISGYSGKYSLASLGITTGTWTENGILHLQGDEDDAAYASKEDKLTKMIESDPDKVMDILSKAGQNLYDKLSNMMKTSSLSSTQTVYYDKQMKSQVEDYDDEIEKLQTKLTDMQDKYYSQFSKMEVALSKLNATASQLGFQTTTANQS